MSGIFSAIKLQEAECGEGDPDEPLCGCACCSWWLELAKLSEAAEAEKRG